jgi:hypothetical protein
MAADTQHSDHNSDFGILRIGYAYDDVLYGEREKLFYSIYVTHNCIDNDRDASSDWLASSQGPGILVDDSSPSNVE